MFNLFSCEWARETVFKVSFASKRERNEEYKKQTVGKRQVHSFHLGLSKSLFSKPFNPSQALKNNSKRLAPSKVVAPGFPDGRFVLFILMAKQVKMT